MTSIAVIKQVVRFDKVKVNNICIYELERIISRADSRSRCIYEVDPNMRRANTRRSNCDRISNRKNKNTYETAAGAGTGLGVGVLHVVEEDVDVGEVVVVGEVVIGVRGVRDEEVSSRAEHSPKTLSSFFRTGLKEVRFQRPTVPTCGACRKPGWGRS